MPPMLTNPKTQGGVVYGSRRRISIKTANYTVLEGESGTYFSNLGAGGLVVFTLPAPSAGLWYDFGAAVVAQDLVVKTATADTLIVFNDIAADQIAFNTANEICGGCFRAICLDGTNWTINEFSHDAQTSQIATA